MSMLRGVSWPAAVDLLTVGRAVDDNEDRNSEWHEDPAGEPPGQSHLGNPIEDDPIEDDDAGPVFIPTYDPTKPMVMAGVVPASESQNKFVDMLEHGFPDLCQVVLDEIEKLHATLAGADRIRVLTACWEVLLSTDARVLRCLLEGTIVKENHNNREVHQTLQRLRMRAQKVEQPCVYGNFVATPSGSPPTARETLQILNGMQRYATATDADAQRFAFKVDTANQSYEENAKQWVSNMTANGLRKYLHKDPANNTPSPHMVQRVTAFVDAVRSRISKLPHSSLDMPLQPPMAEIGYTTRSESRLQDHAKHRNSNRLMNLFEAVSMVTFNDKYRVRQFILYLIWSEKQVPVAEIIFTVLSNGYASEGFGFTYFDPDDSVSSSTPVSPEQWDTFVSYAYWFSPYARNNDATNHRMERTRKERESLEAKIKDLRLVLTILEEANATYAASLATQEPEKSAEDIEREEKFLLSLLVIEMTKTLAYL